MRIKKIGIHLQGLFQLLNGCIELFINRQTLPQVRVILQVQGIEFDRTAKVWQPFPTARCPAKKQPIPVVGIAVIRIQLESTLELPLRFTKFEQTPVSSRHRVVRFRQRIINC